MQDLAGRGLEALHMTNRLGGFFYIFDAAGALANDWLMRIIDSLGIHFWVRIFRFGKGPSDQLFRSMELTIGRRTWGFGDTHCNFPCVCKNPCHR